MRAKVSLSVFVLKHICVHVCCDVSNHVWHVTVEFAELRESTSLGGNEVNVKDVPLPLIRRIQLVPMSAPFYLGCLNSPWKGQEAGKR